MPKIKNSEQKYFVVIKLELGFILILEIGSAQTGKKRGRHEAQAESGIPRQTPEMVSQSKAAASMEERPDSLSGLDLRNNASADAGCDGISLLRPIS